MLPAPRPQHRPRPHRRRPSPADVLAKLGRFASFSSSAGVEVISSRSKFPAATDARSTRSDLPATRHRAATCGRPDLGRLQGRAAPPPVPAPHSQLPDPAPRPGPTPRPRAPAWPHSSARPRASPGHPDPQGQVPAALPDLTPRAGQLPSPSPSPRRRPSLPRRAPPGPLFLAGAARGAPRAPPAAVRPTHPMSQSMAARGPPPNTLGPQPAAAAAGSKHSLARSHTRAAGAAGGDAQRAACWEM